MSTPSSAPVRAGTSSDATRKPGAVPSEEAALRTRKTAGWSVVAAVLGMTVMLWPTPEGLLPEGQRAMALLIAILVLWISEALPLGVTALLVVSGLLATQPQMEPAQLFTGFSSPTFFFLLGVLGIGCGVSVSGLAGRIGDALTRSARGHPRRVYWQLVTILPVLPLALPSGMTRNAILIPIYRDVVGGGWAGLPQTARAGAVSPSSPGADPLAKAVLLVLGVLNPVASSMTLTGGTVSIAAAMLIGGVGWGQWLLWMGIPYFTMFWVGALVIYVMTGLARRPSVGRIRSELAPLSNSGDDRARRWTTAEKRTGWALAGAFALWLTDSWHGWSPALPALGALAVLLVPGPGALSWNEFQRRFSWTALLTMGAVLSLAETLQATGAVAWLADRFLGAIGPWSLSAVQVYVLVAAVSIVSHLAVPGFVPNISLMVPWAMALAPHLGVAPIAAALVATIANDSIVLYPVQTTTSLMAYEQGQTTAKDVGSLGLVMAGALFVLIPLVILPYWRLIGLL